jgi:hypothetical protein
MEESLPYLAAESVNVMGKAKIHFALTEKLQCENSRKAVILAGLPRKHILHEAAKRNGVTVIG